MGRKQTVQRAFTNPLPTISENEEIDSSSLKLVVTDSNGIKRCVTAPTRSTEQAAQTKKQKLLLERRRKQIERQRRKRQRKMNFLMKHQKFVGSIYDDPWGM